MLSAAAALADSDAETIERFKQAGKSASFFAGADHDGMAVFTIMKGGAMYELSVQGQKFSYKPGLAE